MPPVKHSFFLINYGLVFVDLLGRLSCFFLVLVICVDGVDRTTVMNSTLLVSQLPNILSSRVEKFSVRKYDENGEKQRKGMLTVLEMLREKY